MGLFDTFLKVIEEGDLKPLEQSFVKAIDGLEASVGHIVDQGEKLAQTSDKAIQKVDQVAQNAGRTIDAVAKKIQ